MSTCKKFAAGVHDYHTVLNKNVELEPKLHNMGMQSLAGIGSKAESAILQKEGECEVVGSNTASEHLDIQKERRD